MEPDELDGDRKPGLVFVVGLVAIVSGLVGLGTIAYWYGADMGWFAGSGGSTIDGSRSPIGAAASVPAAAALVGIVTLLLRRDVSVRSVAGVLLLGANVLLALAVIVAVDAYPQVENAQLSAPVEHWRADLPVTHVFGLRSETGETITIVGRADRRGCNWEVRAVTLDRSTGEIRAVEVLPTFYSDSSEIPPPPSPLDPGFVLLQGSTPFICRN